MLHFSPTPTLNFSACDQITALMHSRPLPPPWLPQVQLALVVIISLAFAASSLVWEIYHRHRRMAHQPPLSVHLANLGCFFGVVCYFGRDATIGSDGYPNALCPALLCSLLLCETTLGMGAWMQQILVLRRIKRSKLIRQAAMPDLQHDDSESVVSAESSRVETIFTQRAAFELVVFVIKAALLIDSGTAGLANELASPYALSHVRKSMIPKAPDSKTHLKPQSIYKMYRLKKRTLALMLSVFAIPSLLVIIVTIIATPAHREGCKGCEFLWEDFIAGCVIAIFWSMLLMRSTVIFLNGIKQGHIIDEYNDWQALAFGLAFTVAGFVLVIVLLAYDPNSWQFNFKVTWEWVGFAGLLIAACFNSFRPATIVLLERAGLYDFQGKSTLRERVDIETLRKDLVQLCLEDDEEFTSYCELRFVMENVRFITAVQIFKTYFFEKSAIWRKSKANLLFELFLDEGVSALEVNISDAARRKVREILTGGGDVPFELFDNAFAEVETMLLQDVYLGFANSRTPKERKTISSKVPFTRSGKSESGGPNQSRDSVVGGRNQSRDSVVGGV